MAVSVNWGLGVWSPTIWVDIRTLISVCANFVSLWGLVPVILFS